MSYKDLFAQMPGVEFESALANMNGDCELYAASLRAAASMLPGMISELDIQQSSGNLDGFHVTVHGIKGALATLGVTELALKADVLNKAAATGNGSEIAEKWPSLRRELLDFVKLLNTLFE